MFYEGHFTALFFFKNNKKKESKLDRVKNTLESK